MFIVEKKPKSIPAESYRVLRTNIQYSSVDKEIKSIVITSAEPGEGKSTTAGNLALAFSQDEKKVLLIDCDLRKPRIHKKFRISNTAGLIDLVLDPKKKDKVINKYTENLSVLPAGKVPPNPAEILGSKALENLLNSFKDEYDLIILDTPPLHAVTDAQILSTKVDGTILVIRAEKTKKDSVIEAKEALLKVNANILGTVLNGGESSSRKYYYYYGE